MKDLITEARELCEKATPGPWGYDGMHNEIHAPHGDEYFLIMSELREHPGEKILDEYGHSYNANFALIARSRTLIPELCDALEKAEAELIHYHHLQKVTEGQMKQNQRLRRQLEKAEEQNKQLLHEVCKLACESVEREKTLARLEAEVEGWAKADQEGRLVVLPCKVGDTVYTVDLDCEDNPDHTKMCFCWNKSCKSCEKAYLRVWENRTKTVDIRSIVAEMGLCGEDGGFGKTVFLTRAEAEEALKGGTT